MKIAVIEDSLPVRRLLVKRAEHEAGVTVVAQASGEDEAVDAVLATAPQVVLLDLHLAPGCGLSVLSRLRRLQFAGEVFVLSATDRGAMAARCAALGANAFYDKAFDFEQLLVDLRDLAHRTATHLGKMFQDAGPCAAVSG